MTPNERNLCYVSVMTALRIARERKGDRPAGEGKWEDFLLDNDIAWAAVEKELAEPVIILAPEKDVDTEPRPTKRRGKAYPPEALRGGTEI